MKNKHLNIVIAILLLLIVGVVVWIALEKRNEKDEVITGDATPTLSVATGGSGFEGITPPLTDPGPTAKGAVDGRSMARALADTIFSCDHTAVTVPPENTWTDSEGTVYFKLKPKVAGQITDQSMLRITEGQTRVFDGNGIPSHAIGLFPPEEGSEAAALLPEAGTLAHYILQYALDLQPEFNDIPTCIPDGPIGVMLSGAVLYSALDEDQQDAVVTQPFDDCQGQTTANGQYHYHYNPSCFDEGDPAGHSALIGYALDGFGIYGPRNKNGENVTNDQLDFCHGHTEEVTLADGTVESVYHYHANNEFPYTVGCFRGGVTEEEIKIKSQGLVAPQQPQSGVGIVPSR